MAKLEAATEVEFKKELRRLVSVIVDEDEYSVEVTIQAIIQLCSLAELKVKKSVCLGMVDEVLPEESMAGLEAATEAKFKKELGREELVGFDIMAADPVLDSVETMGTEEMSGQEAEFFKELGHLNCLLEELMFSSRKKEAVKAIRSFTLTEKGSLKEFGKIASGVGGVIDILLDPTDDSVDDEMIENICVLMSKIILYKENVPVLATSNLIAPWLVHALKEGTPEAKKAAAATLLILCESDPVSKLLDGPAAIEPLLKMEALAPIEVGKAIASLAKGNSLIVRKVLDLGGLEFIADFTKEEEEESRDTELTSVLMELLAILSQNVQAAKQLGEHGIFPKMFGILRCSKFKSKDLESCLVVLKNVCFGNWRLLILLWAEEVANQTFSRLSTESNVAKAILGELKGSSTSSFATDLQNLLLTNTMPELIDDDEFPAN